VSQVPNETELLYSSLDADPDLGELVRLFVAEMPERVAMLLARSDAAEWEELRRTAHQLRGAAGSYGFDPITPAAGRVEDSIRCNATEQEIREAVDALVDLCSRASAGAAS
jgi:histidine phosphotransfer protein HptB